MLTFKVYLKGNFKDNIMTIIGLKELSQNAGKIADRVAKGERFTVVKRSKPVFEISKPSITNDQSQQEVQDWAKEAIERYRPALTELSKK
jgi:antitoxin (DNA-binding transcriptional repressor) of toxin-antitoxin stability system